MDDKILSRRAALTIFGTAAVGAYSAPAFTTLSMARASDASAASPASDPSPQSDPSPESAPSAESEPSAQSAASDPSVCSSPSDSGCVQG